MSYKIYSVATNFVQQYWDRVKPFIEDALIKGVCDFPDWSASYNSSHIQAFLTGGQWILVIALGDDGEIHGSATVSFINSPLHRAAFVTTIGGKFISTKDSFEQFSNILKSHGATKIQGYCRPSVSRLWKRFNFETRSTLVEVLI